MSKRKHRMIEFISEDKHSRPIDINAAMCAGNLKFMLIDVVDSDKEIKINVPFNVNELDVIIRYLNEKAEHKAKDKNGHFNWERTGEDSEIIFRAAWWLCV